MYHNLEGKMNTKEAVANRIIDLVEEKGMTINELGNVAGVNPSTIYSILGTKSKNPGIVTIKKLCDAMDITLLDFFNSDLFSNLEQELE